MIIVKGVTKVLGGKTVLDDVSLEISTGEVCCITGPNGAGKTLLLNIISNTMKQTKGNVILPMDVSIGYSYQVPRLCDDLSVKENIKFFKDMHGIRGKENGPWIDKLLRDTKIDHWLNRYTGDLSYGTKKRLDIVVSLLHNPDIVILDEPTAALDLESRGGILGIIKFLKNDGKTILIASPDPDDFEGVYDHLIRLENGKKIDDVRV